MGDVTNLNGRREQLRDAATLAAAEDRADFLEEITNVCLGECGDDSPVDVLQLLDDAITAISGTRRALYLAMEAEGLAKFF